jgi:hypothetical protein
MSEEIREDAVSNRTRRLNDFGAATSFTDFGLLACSGRGACVKSKRVCGAEFQGCACASPVIDLPAGKIPVHSGEMA